MNLNTLQWDDHMLQEFGIPKECLAKIQGCNHLFGVIKNGPLEGVRLTGILGDQHAACLGHLLEIGEAKNTYGTGCFLLMNVGEKPVQSKQGLLSTICYNLSGKTYYALEGAVETAGAALSWAKNSVGLIGNYQEIEDLIKTVEDDDEEEVVFVPALHGIFAPYWDSKARGMIIGLTSRSTKAHIVKAICESACLRTGEILKAMGKEEGSQQIKKLKVDGGMTVNNTLMQIQADLLQIEVETKKEPEITCLGAAIAAGLCPEVAIWSDMESLREKILIKNVFKPKLDKEKAEKKAKKFELAVQRSLAWADS